MGVQAGKPRGEETFATYIEGDRLILSGRIAQAEGDARAAVARMREGAENKEQGDVVR